MNKKLSVLAKRYYEYIYKSAPTFATYLGIHKYDHLIGDFSKEAIKRDVKKFKEFKKEVALLKKEIMKQGSRSGFLLAQASRLTGRDDSEESSRPSSNNTLSTGNLRANDPPAGGGVEKFQDWTDYQLLMSDIEANLLFLTKSKDWRKNPNIYVETPLMGVFLLISRDTLTLSQRVRAVASRLNLYEKMLAQGRANVKSAPRIYTQIALETLAGAQFFVSRVPEELKSRGRISQRGKRALEMAVEKALAALTLHKDYLGELLKGDDVDFSLGRKVFEKRLKLENFLDLDARGLLELGLREFTRIEGELTKLARDLSEGKTWPQLVEEYKKLVPEKYGLVDLYKREVTSLIKFLKKKQLVTFPKKEICIVEETPSFERPTVPYAAYMPPAPFEAKQVGFFWVTPINASAPTDAQKEQLKEHSLPSFMITTLHESYPGHHLQFCLANEGGSLVRKHGQSSLLCEGWALYCEQMMGEEGYYTDPRTKLFMLKDELWRAARVIIDVSMHCFGMTPQEAIKILVEKVKLAPTQAEAEVKRYTMSPTQPMSYLVGKLLILEMRERAKKLWGNKFSLKKFHDAFLSCGTIPQPLIEKELFPKKV